MAEVQFQALNLHAKIDEKTIIIFMNDAMKKAENGKIWLCFDKINTCNHIGLLSDLISNRVFQCNQIFVYLLLAIHIIFVKYNCQ